MDDREMLRAVLVVALLIVPLISCATPVEPAASETRTAALVSRTATPAPLPSPTIVPSPTPVPWQSYCMRETIRIGGIGKLWMPVPREWDGVGVSNVEVKDISPQPNDLYEDEQGNLIAFWEADEGITAEYSITFGADVRPITYDIDPASIDEYDTTSWEYQRYTQPSKWIQSDDERIIQLAREIVGDEANPYEQARLVHRWVSTEIEGGDPADAITTLERRAAGCGGHSWLFCALLRSLGVPARGVGGRGWPEGQFVDSSAHAGYPEERTLPIHIWSEFYLPGYGWIQSDTAQGLQNFAGIGEARLPLFRGGDIELRHGYPLDTVPWFHTPNTDVVYGGSPATQTWGDFLALQISDRQDCPTGPVPAVLASPSVHDLDAMLGAVGDGSLELAWPVSGGRTGWCVCEEFEAGRREGLSICTERNTPVLAVSDGSLSFVRVEPEQDGSQWAIGLSCAALNGRLVKYKSLDSVVEGLQSGDIVRQGGLLGYSGVRGGVPMLELEGYSGPEGRFDLSPHLDWTDVERCEAAAPLSPKTATATWQSYCMRETIRIGDIEKLWMPVPREWDGVGMRNIDVKDISPPPDDLWEDEQGNLIAFWDVDEGTTAEYSITFGVDVKAIHYDIDPDSIGEYDESSWEYQRYTQPSKWIQSDDERIVQLAKEITGAETNRYEQARLVFRWVSDNLRGGDVLGALAALEAGGGDCAGHSYLFVALLRALGIPARAVGGYGTGYNDRFTDARTQDGRVEGATFGGHVWSEFYLPGYGWIQCDTTGGHEFADIMEPRIVMCRGEDIQLGHGHPEDSIPWFTMPNAEGVDGYTRQNWGEYAVLEVSGRGDCPTGPVPTHLAYPDAVSSTDVLTGDGEGFWIRHKPSLLPVVECPDEDPREGELASSYPGCRISKSFWAPDGTFWGPIVKDDYVAGMGMNMDYSWLCPGSLDPGDGPHPCPPAHELKGVYAVDDGVVTRVAFGDDGGGQIFLEHAGGIVSHYGHIRDPRGQIQVGARVRGGEKIGEVDERWGFFLAFALHHADDPERAEHPFAFGLQPDGELYPPPRTSASASLVGSFIPENLVYTRFEDPADATWALLIKINAGFDASQLAGTTTDLTINGTVHTTISGWVAAEQIQKYGGVLVDYDEEQFQSEVLSVHLEVRGTDGGLLYESEESVSNWAHTGVISLPMTMDGRSLLELENVIVVELDDMDPTDGLKSSLTSDLFAAWEIDFNTGMIRSGFENNDANAIDLSFANVADESRYELMLEKGQSVAWYACAEVATGEYGNCNLVFDPGIHALILDGTDVYLRDIVWRYGHILPPSNTEVFENLMGGKLKKIEPLEPVGVVHRVTPGHVWLNIAAYAYYCHQDPDPDTMECDWGNPGEDPGALIMPLSLFLSSSDIELVLAAFLRGNPRPQEAIPTSTAQALPPAAPEPTTPPQQTEETALAWPAAMEGQNACVCEEYAPSSHEGLSICAERGTPVLAVSDGELTFVRVEPEDGASEWAVGLSCAALDGLLIKYKHLDSVVDGLEPGGRVSVGDTLGYVGVRGDVALLELEGYTGPVERFDPSPYLDWSDVEVCPAVR